ncbi:MAG: 16S rRNA (cytidine(1402)-2'-O)-methyltransferase [bacterium]
MLYVCATPIGNISDCSQRLIDTLKQVDAVAAEDTRRAQHLFTLLSIPPTSFVRLDQHKERDGSPQILSLLTQQKHVALLSDAGTPAISDPGAYLVSSCIAQNIPVCPIPGACSITALLSVSGFDASTFVFGGFFPRQTRAARDCLQRLSHAMAPIVFFESPKRLLKTLSFLVNLYPQQRMVCAKELSKLHEGLFYGSVASVYQQVQSISLKGEWCFVLDLPSPDTLKLSELLPYMLSLGFTHKQILALSKKLGLSKNVVYEWLLTHSSS